MAVLNLREKVIEARVAYVGRELAAARLLAELKEHPLTPPVSPSEGAASFSFDVGPVVRPELRDCALRLNVTTWRDDGWRDGLAAMLAEIDGVVVVLEPSTEAEEQNRETVAAVRALIGDRTTPLLTQWSERPTSSEVGPEETFNEVVDAVMQSMTPESFASKSNAPAAGDDRPTANANPLLTALQRILEQTAEAHVTKAVEKLGARLEERLESQLRAVTERLEAVAQSQPQLSALAERAERAATREDVAAAAIKIEQDVAKLAVVQSERVTVLESSNDLVWRHVSNANEELLKAARHAPTREDLAALVTDLRAELARLIEGSEASNKEAVASVVATLRRTLESVTAEVKRTATREAAGALAGALDAVREGTKTMTATATNAIAPLPGLIGKVEESTKNSGRDLRVAVVARLEHVDDRLQEITAGLGSQAESGAQSLERLGKLEAAVNEIVEEMKKPRKSWFG